VLTFVDGVTDAPITPTAVSPTPAAVGAAVTASLEGYLTREQRWTGLPVALWPVPRDGGESALRDLVYDGEQQALTKWASMNLTAVLTGFGPDTAADESRARDAVNAVFVEVSGAGGPRIAFADAPSGNLTVRVDPAHECLEERYIACARWWHDGATITRAELIYASADWTQDAQITRRMLGFAIGLRNWDQPGAAMRSSWSGRGTSWHEVELAAIHMMYQHRNAGNTLPDRDPAIAAASGARGRGLAREVSPR
jgi:hypothetical protein